MTVAVSWKFQTVAIVGSGAIGLYYGGRLAKKGEVDVKFLARADQEVLQRQGLRVKSVHGDFEVEKVQSFSTPEEIGPVDLVIVAWKATSNHLLKVVLPPLLHQQTQVITLQNGLGNCDLLEEIVGAERVLGAMCFAGINRTAPGVLDHSSGGRIMIGEWTKGMEGRASELVRVMKAAGLPAVVVENLQQAQWEKLVWNVPFNGLSVAMGGWTTEQILADEQLVQRMRVLMGEVVTAGRALGLEMGEDLIDFNINRTRPMGPYKTSSMIDFVEGREVELGPIWEEPIRQARKVGVEMIETERLLAEMKARIADR